MTGRPPLSSHHPQAKLCRKLQQAKYRRELGLFLIEGPKLLAEARRAGVAIQQVFAREDAIETAGDALPVTAAVMAGMATTDTPPPLLAIGRIPTPAAGAAVPLPELFPVLVGVQDAGNLGAVARVVHAVGCGALGLAAGTVDPYNPKALRGSMGSLFHVRLQPIADRDAFLAGLRGRGYAVVAAALGGDRLHYDQDFRRPTVLLLGSEGGGLPAPWLAAADGTVTIPLHGGAESLNVAVATGVLLYEALRQRSYS